MIRRIRNSVLFFAALFMAQQMLSWLGETMPIYKEQQKMIKQQDMDPAVFFYTESERALEAEKEVRERVMGEN